MGIHTSNPGNLTFIKIRVDVEENPDPKSIFCEKFSIFHLAHDFVKLSLLRAYVFVYIFDIVCLPEIYLYVIFLFKKNNLGKQGIIY